MFTEGNASMRNLLGGKGANLAEMTNLGLPIPQGFTITTEACNNYYQQGQQISEVVLTQINAAMHKLEALSGKKFGDQTNPLLVSVRSGARVSMPGMMDTILNLGLNDITVEGLQAKSGNLRFARDSYRRFIQMFADVVKEVPKNRFEKVLDNIKQEKNIRQDTELTAQDWQEVIVKFKQIYHDALGEDFPQDPQTQLLEAVKAVFRSWDNPRAQVYRRMNDIPGDWGTAVNVQMMVFGNLGETSGTGVAFTRNPATGEKKIFGEYLINAQGEDVVAGIRTPKSITALADDMPTVYRQFITLAERLEKHYRDMQDMEFTIESGKLYFLQTRNGKRTAPAAVRIAVDLVNEGMIDKKEAVLRVEPKSLDSLLHPVFVPEALANAQVLTTGLPASPGAAAGRVYFTAEDAKAAAQRGERVILTRMETSPEDIEGMAAAEGILTMRGGMTSHAAVVARGMGTCCVAGCDEITVNEEEKFFTKGKIVVKEGDYISLNGSKGNVYLGDIATVEPTVAGEFATFMEWADNYRTLKVCANADQPQDAANALKFGAEGIGLCRTEHMFFEEDRIPKMRKMILASGKEERIAALNELLPFQREDFINIYKVMQDKPVTVRLLDPPLHEFLPQEEDAIIQLAQNMQVSTADLKNKIARLHEFNPMMGHRGCRLCVTYPEIAVMQTRAIIEAALQVKKAYGYNIIPEIMIPLVGEYKEFVFVKKYVKQTADEIIAASEMSMDYMIGTMMETPRGCLVAGEIAQEAAFFSFGTNDLTQMTFGFSRDDAGSFLDDYYKNKIYEFDPFARLDQKGVGELVRIAVERGRKTCPHLKVGICGEHGGDPSSIEFFLQNKLDYISCSPFRVPAARLAAAQAAIKQQWFALRRKIV